MGNDRAEFVYDAPALREDATGYGVVLYVAQGTTLVGGLAGSTERLALLPASGARNFLNQLYALIRTTRAVTIYRFYGRTSAAEAGLLGAYWSPARPSLAIDQLGYESWHDRSRADLGLKRSWNPMREVVEAELAPGVLLYFGRVAPQVEGREQFGGGSVQFLIPTPGHRLHLARNYLV